MSVNRVVMKNDQFLIGCLSDVKLRVFAVKIHRDPKSIQSILVFRERGCAAVCYDHRFHCHMSSRSV